MKPPPDRPHAPTRKRQLSPKKLLLSKWTAVTPMNKEKHFVVTRVVAPDPPRMTIGQVEMQAVHSGRSMTVSWDELTDSSRWHQGWL
jgi:tryptophan-rich hypothetical protein